MKNRVAAAVALTTGVIIAAASGAVRAEPDDIEFTRTVCLSLRVFTTVKPENPDVSSSMISTVPGAYLNIVEKIHSDPEKMIDYLAPRTVFDLQAPMLGGFPDHKTSRHCFVIQIQVRPRIEIVEEPEPDGENRKEM